VVMGEAHTVADAGVSVEYVSDSAASAMVIAEPSGQTHRLPRWTVQVQRGAWVDLFWAPSFRTVYVVSGQGLREPDVITAIRHVLRSEEPAPAGQEG
jgi:hypothetical protein